MVMVGMLTFHSAYNYGAILQCYALNKTLNSMPNVTAEVIDYRPEYFERFYRLLPSKSESFKYTHLVSYVRSIQTRSIIANRNKKFEEFIKNNIKLSARKYTQKKLLRVQDLPYDIYFTGSDQVFNTTLTYGDDIYFLDIPSAKNKIKCSYAASFGKIEINNNYIEKYQKTLSRFQYISVREESGVRNIEKILGRNAEISCDPTFLLTSDDWTNLVQEDNQFNGPYILIYYVENPGWMRFYAHDLSIRTNMHVICMHSACNYRDYKGIPNEEFGFKTITDEGPESFVSAFYHASFVLTNSFHGTVFSAMFHKKFLSQIDVEENGSLIRNNRSKQLLDSLCLSCRVLQRDCADIVNCINQPIDWGKTDKVIEDMRLAGLEYIKKIVEP